MVRRRASVGARATRGLIYIGTYLRRDMAGLRRLMREPMLEEIVFMFDGRSRDGGIDEPSEELINRLITADNLSTLEDCFIECREWAQKNYADSWALASRENLCRALKEFGPALYKLGVNVRVVGCNPRESKRALRAFAGVIFEGILNGKRVAYAEASMTRVGSPIMRWLLAVTDSKIFYVPPKEWADPFLTFVLNPEVSGRLANLLDQLGNVNGHSREIYVEEIEKAVAKALYEYLSSEDFLERVRGKLKERGFDDKNVDVLKDALEGFREGDKKLVMNRVEFNRNLEAREGEKVEEIPILVMRTILPREGRIAVNNPLLVLKALYDLTKYGEEGISINEFAKGMDELLREKLGIKECPKQKKRRGEESVREGSSKRSEDGQEDSRKDEKKWCLVSYQRLRPVLDMLDGKFLTRRSEGRSIILKLNDFGKELAAAIPEKIYEIVKVDSTGE